MSSTVLLMAAKPQKSRLKKRKRVNIRGEVDPRQEQYKKASNKKRKTEALLLRTMPVVNSSEHAAASSSSTTTPTIRHQHRNPLDTALALLDAHIVHKKEALQTKAFHDELDQGRFREWYLRWRVGCAVHFNIVNVDQQHSCYLSKCTQRAEIMRQPEPAEEWMEVAFALYKQTPPHKRRTFTVEATKKMHYQALMRNVQTTVFFGCKLSGRHHRCHGTRQCPFVIRPNQRQLESADVHVCLSSGVECYQEFAPQEYWGEKDKTDIRDQINGTRAAMKIADRRLQRTAAAASSSSATSKNGSSREEEEETESEEEEEVEILIPAAKRRKMNETISSQQQQQYVDHITTERVPWNDDATDLFFGRSVDTRRMRAFSPDELSPHWILTPASPQDEYNTLPVDDYWCTQLFREPGESGGKQPLPCIRDFIERHGQKSPAPLQRINTSSTMHTSSALVASRISAASATTTDLFARQEVARFLTMDIWQSKLREQSVSAYTEVMVPFIFRDMIPSSHKIRNNCNQPDSPLECTCSNCAFIKQHVMKRDMLKEAEWIGRHAVAVALASGRLTTYQCWNNIMGTSDASKFPHTRISKANLIATILECGIEQYLYHRFSVEFSRHTRNIELSPQLDEIYKFWIETQIPNSHNSLFEPLAIS